MAFVSGQFLLIYFSFSAKHLQRSVVDDAFELEIVHPVGEPEADDEGDEADEHIDAPVNSVAGS